PGLIAPVRLSGLGVRACAVAGLASVVLNGALRYSAAPSGERPPSSPLPCSRGGEVDGGRRRAFTVGRPPVVPLRPLPSPQARRWTGRSLKTRGGSCCHGFRRHVSDRR